MKSEAYLRRTITSSLRAMGYLAQPIESGLTGLGIPDLFVRTKHTSAWIELKNFKYRLVYPVTVPFRTHQKEWLRKLTGLGGTAILIISEPDCIHVFANKKIMGIYMDSLSKSSDLSMPKFSGQQLVELLDGLK